MRKLLFASLLFILACGKDDPVPRQADYESRAVVEVEETVSFTNRSTGASRYEWDFGNGRTSTQANPTTAYDTVGHYTVTLSSYDSDNQVSTVTRDIRVGKRYLKSIVIRNMSFVQLTGQPWNTSGSNGALNIYMLYRNRPYVPFITDSLPGAKASLLPYKLKTAPYLNIREMKKGNTWTFSLYKYDYVGSNTYYNPELMYSWELPINGPTANRDAQGNGFYSLTGPASNPGSYNVEVNYETL